MSLPPPPILGDLRLYFSSVRASFFRTCFLSPLSDQILFVGPIRSIREILNICLWLKDLARLDLWPVWGFQTGSNIIFSGCYGNRLEAILQILLVIGDDVGGI